MHLTIDLVNMGIVVAIAVGATLFENAANFKNWKFFERVLFKVLLVVIGTMLAFALLK